MQKIIVKGARVHNLKNVSIEIPRDKLIVFTGLSGSGKSSLAFDTIYAEGQRRYVESLSAYARQFLTKLDKPDVDSIDGLSPAISIDQKSPSHNPRSTVGTVTEIYDYLRLLFSSVGTPHCPNCGKEVRSQSIQEMTDQISQWKVGTQITILAPVTRDKKGEGKALFEQIRKDGFSRVQINGKLHRLDEKIELDKQKKHDISVVVDRLTIEPENRTRLFESLETAAKYAKGLVMIETSGKPPMLMSEQFACPDCQVSLPEVSPRLFSFNSPIGACSVCRGLGDKLDFDPALIFSDENLPLYLASQKCLNLDDTIYGRYAETLCHAFGFSLNTKVKDLTEAQRSIILNGPTADDIEQLKKAGLGNRIKSLWEGIIPNLRRRYLQTESEMMRLFFQNFMTETPCDVCNGSRLNQYALAVKVGKKSIFDLTELSIDKLTQFFTKLKLNATQVEISRQILKEINTRLSFLNNVGLSYLNLGRNSSTLSGGEFQRIRLATQIGSGLTGVLYVLDEPSIGLHQRDNRRLIDSLIRLRDLGNTIIVVEHDEEMMEFADHIVDIGPGAGVNGGEILYSGPLSKIGNEPRSVTAAYLTGKKRIEIPKKRREYAQKSMLTIQGARENNLKNLTVSIPLGVLTCVTGVSGSGKSTLINDTLQKALMRHFYKSNVKIGQHDAISGLDNVDKIITIDQSPIGRTPRSNPATYTGVFTPVRDLMAQTKEAKVRGYKAGRFSFNVKGGRCEACEGDGVVKIEMHFLSDVYVTCDVCKGKRYNEETLTVRFKGKTISEILDMTVDQAMVCFENVPAIASKLQSLQEVGLGYIGLGQNATTLSGGEAQRIKLAKELSKRSTGKTLYVLDEPTTGLHFDDIQKLLHVLNQLVESGNSVLVIEHNLDVIKTADYIIDLGPEGGSGGGQLVASGTPEDVAKVAESYTGQYLKKILNRLAYTNKKGASEKRQNPKPSSSSRSS